jgi:hypothetical protein
MPNGGTFIIACTGVVTPAVITQLTYGLYMRSGSIATVVNGKTIKETALTPAVVCPRDAGSDTG